MSFHSTRNLNKSLNYPLPVSMHTSRMSAYLQAAVPSDSHKRTSSAADATEDPKPKRARVDDPVDDPAHTATLDAL